MVVMVYDEQMQTVSGRGKIQRLCGTYVHGIAMVIQLKGVELRGKI